MRSLGQCLINRKIQLRKNLKVLTQVSKVLFFHCEDVSVQFDEIMALKNVQLTIERGEIIFLTGPSGAGKTTLLKVLSGLQDPTSGRVIRPDFFSGKKNLFISNVFQDLRLMGKYTCEENLLFAYDSSIYQSKAEFLQDMNELSRILGVKDRLHLKVNEANGGLKQKVAIIRSLLHTSRCFNCR